MTKHTVAYITNEGSFWRLGLAPADVQEALYYSPGQYAALSLLRDGRWTPVRCLSLTSSPRKDGVIEFGFKVTGNFTRALAESNVGDEINIQGPFGDFVLPDDDPRPVIFLAGGIGITPFVSMLRDIDAQGDPRAVTLLHSTYKAGTLPFEDEIQTIAARHRSMKVYRLADVGVTPENGYFQGKINKRHLASLASHNPNGFLYYICGPEPMMRGLTKQLLHMGVFPENIRTESFSTSNNSQRTFFGMSATKSVYGLSSAAIAAFALVFGVIGVRDALAKAQPSLQSAPSSSAVAPSDGSSGSSSDASGTSGASSTPATTPSDSSASSGSSSGSGSSSSSSSSSMPSNNSYYYYQPPVSQVS